jgi:hypothetical protein
MSSFLGKTYTAERYILMYRVLEEHFQWFSFDCIGDSPGDLLKKIRDKNYKQNLRKMNNALEQ